MVENSLKNPNDKGYKYLLSNEKFFMEMLETFVDQGWVSQIDSQAITRIENSYIPKDFSEQEADLIYRLKLQGVEIIFYLLLELQSTVDFQMPYRLLRYMMGIWQDVLKNTDSNEAAQKEFKMPVIVPIVLYNGIGQWTAQRQFKDTLAAVELFDDYTVNFKYILLDVNRYREETLKQLPNLIKAAFWLDQKSTPEDFIRRLKELTQFLGTLTLEDYDYFKAWLQTIAARGIPERAGEIIEIINESRPEEVAHMVYNFEQTIRDMKNEALLTGQMQGKLEDARKMLDKNMPEELISEITGISIDQIRKLKESSPGKEIQ